MSDATLKELQDFYDKHRDWQADCVILSLSLHDLIMLVRNVMVKDD